MIVFPARMAALLILLVQLSSCATISATETTVYNTTKEALTLKPFHPAIRYQGRWITTDSEVAKVGWAGSKLEIQFSGTSVSVDIDAGSSHEFYRVLLDNESIGEPLRLSQGRQIVTLVEGLNPTKSHTLTLFKETYYGDLSTIHGLTINQGRVQQLPALPTMKIAFFGDSNMDGTSLYSEKDSGESGAYYAYPAMVGRMLNAQVNIQAFGGATLTKNDGNNVYNFITANEKFVRTPDFYDDFEPDAIVINAGANDIYQIKQTPLENIVKARFAKVVTELRRVYGQKPHIVLYNAYGWSQDEPANYTFELLNELKDENLSVLHYPWMWEQWHGAMAEHGGQARLLANHIVKNVAGFNIEKPADVFNGFGANGNVANGSFENVAPGEFNAFGWRYADDGVNRIKSDNASDGHFFIRLTDGQQVHQGNDASGDFTRGGLPTPQTYEISVDVRGHSATSLAELFMDVEEQDLYQRKGRKTEQFNVNDDWQRVSAEFTAPAGTWKTYFGLRAAEGTVDFDNVTVRRVEE